ncbi:MAG: right-handed parallel beta-helix repeat-containing protein [Polyangiales bacterium]
MLRFIFSFLLAVLSLSGCGDEANNSGGSGGTGGAGSGGDGGIGGADSAVWPCTEQGIRDAIAVGGGPNTFLCSGPTTVVTEAPIQIDDDVILDGEGKLTVDGGGDHRVFVVGTPMVITPDSVTVEFRNLNITGGFAELPEVGGGGILSGGQLTIVNCEITRNRASGGSGIESFGDLHIQGSRISENDGTWAISHQGVAIQGEALTIVDSTISDNVGGGLLVLRPGGSISRTTISGNRALEEEHGGGISNAGDLFIWNTVITGNEAERGGGIWNGGDLSIVDSTVAENAGGEGGGIYNADPFLPDLPVFGIGLLNLHRSTVSGNTAERGGGIYTAGLWQRITNSTVSGNSANEGGGIAMAGTKEGPSSLTLANTTVADNAANEGSAIWALGELPELRFVGAIVAGSCHEAEGTVDWVSNGSNIESPGDTCNFSQMSDQPGVAPDALKLGSLGDNGGFTDTHAPEAGSVAIDAMLPEDCALSLPEPLDDQRYLNRPLGPACDAGSVEFEE